MKIELCCAYCGYRWLDSFQTKAQLDMAVCPKCSDSTLIVKDANASKVDYYAPPKQSEEKKIDYYAGAPAFPEAERAAEWMDFYYKLGY